MASDVQPGSGAGNAPPAPTAGAAFRAMKTGEAIQRIQAANGIATFLEKCVGVFDGERVVALATKCMTIVEEAAQSLLG